MARPPAFEGSTKCCATQGTCAATGCVSQPVAGISSSRQGASVMLAGLEVVKQAAGGVLPHMHLISAPFTQASGAKRSSAGHSGPKAQSITGFESAPTTEKKPEQMPLLMRSSTQVRWHSPESVEGKQPDRSRMQFPVQLTLPVVPAGQTPTPESPSHCSPSSS